MEHLDAPEDSALFGRVDAGDPATLLRRTRIAFGGHDHGQRGIAREDRRLAGRQLVLCAGEQDLDEIALEPHHQHLALGIAEARVVFDQLRPLRGQHQPGIEHARIGHALIRQRLDGRRDDLCQDFAFEDRGQHARRAIGAHAAGVRAGIAIADALVILRRAEGHDRRSIGQREEARFLALEEFLDHGFGPGVSEAAREDLAHGVFGFGHGHGDGHALARGKPVGLDHDRRAEPRECGHASSLAGDALIAGGGNIGARAEVLGEALAAFELGGLAARPEHREAGAAQRIAEAVDQRRLGPDHHQTDAVRLAESDRGGVIGDVERHQFGVLGDAGVARRGEEPIAKRRLRELPGQRMFAPARAQQQDVHCPCLLIMTTMPPMVRLGW